MFAVFGLGPMEIVVLAICGFGVFGLAVVLLVIYLARPKNQNPLYDRLDLLERENQRLREEIAWLTKEKKEVDPEQGQFKT